MSGLTRREALKLFAAMASVGLSPKLWAGSRPKARVAVVGGGFGGAALAKYLRMMDPGIEVILIERNGKLISGPLMNEVLIGERTLDDLTFGYEALQARYGVRVLHDEVTTIDPVDLSLQTRRGRRFTADRIVISPGIGYRMGDIEGYDETARDAMPPAWGSGPELLRLSRQLAAMPDGGTFIQTVPPAPFRCPPGPCERAALVADYFKRFKPRSKVLVLSSNDRLPAQPILERAWAEHYPGMITWTSLTNDGRVIGVDPATMTVYTEFDKHRGDVISVLPPNMAGSIAERTGLTDMSGWCPVDLRSFESTIHPGIHVIGDACRAEPMPKSAYAANSQAKVCAAALVALFNGDPLPEPSFMNGCYAFLTPQKGMTVTAVYHLVDGEMTPVAGSSGLSITEATPWHRHLEAEFALGWFHSIIADTLT